jgi:predicted lipoprotein with Yx(FWY)xxD motif
MKRRYILLSAVLVVAIGYATPANAQPRARKASGATVELGFAGGVYGFHFLVNSAGYTLYQYSKDHRSHDKCQRVKGCTTGWPPLTVTEAPTAGPGVNPALLSTITLRKSGLKQVTYAGHPLYTNSADAAPGEIYYFGFKEFRGNWFGVNESGERIT